MELLLKDEKEPFLCLNMIVKNESHIIKNTLTKLLSKIKVDYWVISDTGSTDNTKELITEFFKEEGIPGELFEDEWKDFGHNRTKALAHAFSKSKYLLVFDADDEICGNFVLPELTKDSYHLQFGDSNGISYTRTQIVNNKKKWKYVGVLHEIITAIENTNGSDIITGDYFTISGKTGDRSRDVNKYLKDALILEKAYEEAIQNNDELYNRYGFYCANSYYDCGKHEEAIKWYKKTLENKNWSQEKYVSCLRIYNCYNSLNQKETGFFYLVKSSEYDKERTECLYELISYYCCNGLYEIAYGYYTIIKKFYSETYLTSGLNNKLFLDCSKSNLYLPYYMILVADKVNDSDTIIQMFRIIFTKKHKEHSKFFIGNMLYNLQFFIERVKDNDIANFTLLFKDYVDFLVSINYPVSDHEFMNKYEKYGINVSNLIKSKFSPEECSKSNKVLIYSGYAPFKWNNSFSVNNALGGSETAITCLSKFFPKEYEIYISGEVEEEKFDNITYINLHNLQNLIKTTTFHTIIVSRYLHFYEVYKNFSAYQTFIWGHDVALYQYGSYLSTESILTKWSSKITGCVCQTEWHKNHFLSLYPQLNNKITVINNGINTELFTLKSKNKKVSNKFIYTSCSERGLSRLIKLWPGILDNLPDAELTISSYNNFPKSEEDNKILEYINQTPSINHVGKLNRKELYELMSSAEYWLYPSYFQETSCITSLELLASEVVCLYYPVAGLVNTIGDYGIQISEGNEIDTLLNLSIKQKSELKKRGKEYAFNCSWKNRAYEWNNLFNKNNHNIQEIDTSEKYPIHIINLKKRQDRKEKIEQKLKLSGINSYDFFEAIDGKELEPSSDLFSLFERNDFNYKKGVIGCALSHIYLWNKLINDTEHDFYIILEDDISFCDNFKKHLNDVCNLFVEQKLEHLALGEYNSDKQFPGENSIIETYSKNLYKEWNTAFAYIISKPAAIKVLNYINSCSIKCASDNPQAFGYILKYSSLNVKLVHCEIINEFGSDIQTNNKDDFFGFTPVENKQNISVSFCDWWKSEYCGGMFDSKNNFFTNLLREYGNNYDVKIVNPHENPDILFYSVFGYSHQNYGAKRKIFFSGEPYGAREHADFNITFDPNSNANTRVPLWLCYFNNLLLDECTKRKNGENIIPRRDKFCSFIATGPGLANNRQEFVEKLSKYKQVTCGGSYLNNIGYHVPIGLNCSGKIEHNNNYKFAMAFESTSYPGYVTEKICDVFKSNCIPIYWGHPEVVKDFNPTTFINANNYSNFDKLIEYIIKVDSNDELYKSFFKEHMLSPEWSDILTDKNKTFFKNLADKIIGNTNRLLDNLNKTRNQTDTKKLVDIYNIWHNKLFDNCYKDLDDYSLSKITMYDVNPVYEKKYNTEKNYKIIKEYELEVYDNLLQSTNYCQTSCLYHIYLNGQIHKSYNEYIGFIQYDMELESDFIYDIEGKINNSKNDVFFYSLIANDKLDRHNICYPYENSILEKYNTYFNTNHTYETIKNHKMSKIFICLHTFVIPTRTYLKMMEWFCSIFDWLHINYINNIYKESMSEVSEEIFGLFLLLQIIENDNIQLEELKLRHNWPNLHNETLFNNYKDQSCYFPLSAIVNNNLTDKNTYHSYIDVYENLFKNRQLSVKNVLEIGIEKGGSLKLWNDYFVNAKIYGLDINGPPQFLSKYERIITHKWDAYCDDTIQYFLDKDIKFDIIIDDGPHSLESMIYSVKNYTKLLATNGILIIEDVPVMDWCEILYNSVDTCLQEFSYNIDRRHIKGTLDDILFMVENKYVKEKAIIIEENIITEKKNRDENNDLWIFYAFEGHNFKILEDYINSLQQSYNIVYTQDIDYVLSCNPKKISYIMYINDDRILNKYKNTEIELSFLNTEPLSIAYNLDLLKQYIYKYPYLKIYDYSFSNLQIIGHNNMYGELLEYYFYEKENLLLKELNLNEPKIYDFGIITYGNTETNNVDNSLFHKKKDVVCELISKGFKIHIISGWGLERDKELARCKVILNIHSLLGINGEIYYSKTFENIRCNRLLDAGFKILSEDSIHCNEMSKKYRDNLKFINYNEFKNIEYSDDFWNKLNNQNLCKKYCFIHSCNLENVGTYRLDYLINKLNSSYCVNIFEKIYINNIGLPIENIYGEKYEVINYSENTQLYENPTINLIKDFSEKNPNSYILYIHTKGVRYNPNDNKENDWIDYMLYFLVEQHKLCISILDNNYDTVGCNYNRDIDGTVDGWILNDPLKHPSHYSGNFWWVNSNYSKTLPLLSIENPERMAPEFWLFENNPVFYNLHSSQVSHFATSYPTNKYVL
jgi:GR25 family glycosyltransferase involved in LPS biosynthesis